MRPFPPPRGGDGSRTAAGSAPRFGDRGTFPAAVIFIFHGHFMRIIFIFILFYFISNALH
jgi:hypothetical protein